MTFELQHTDPKSNARAGLITTDHGQIETPIFMPVGTAATVKSLLPSTLEELGTQILLSNTYHLYLRPGSEIVRDAGGLHKFMTWDGPILTDSGGFQVFSLASLRKIKEDGVTFASHIDGHKIFMGPEESMQIQSNLGSDICMAFDECIENPAPREYVKQSVDRTYRWLLRCKAENQRLNSLPDTVNPQQMLWGINQGGTYADIRIDHMKRIADLDLPGYAIGGLAVGETAEEMYSAAKSCYYKCLEALPFEDQYFDKIIILDHFNNISNYKDALKEISRVLKNDGEIILEDLNLKNSQDLNIFLTSICNVQS